MKLVAAVRRAATRTNKRLLRATKRPRHATARGFKYVGRRVRRTSTATSRLVRPALRPARRAMRKSWLRIRKVRKRTVKRTVKAYYASIRAAVRLAARLGEQAARYPPKYGWGMYRAFASFGRILAPSLSPPYFGECAGIRLKEPGQSFEQSFRGPWGRLRYHAMLDHGNRKKTRTWAEYRKVAHDVPLDVPYVYVALHFQPERTTSSLGGVFGDQYLVVDMLARCLPEGWKVYVKEHPSQFYPPFAGERSRHADLYADLLALPNVELVSLSTSTFQLIDHAMAVATVTGTVGWEAVIRGKPTLAFGSPWYRYCEGVFFTPTESALRDALARVASGYRPEFRKVRLFMRALDEVCARAPLGYNTPDEQELNLPHDAAVQRLAAHLQRTWELMQQDGPAARADGGHVIVMH